MSKLVKALAVVALTLSLGLQWALLQSVAWAGMVISYSQEGSLTSALEKTFDGRHACKLCRVVDAGRSAEESPAVQVKLPKFEACTPVALSWVRTEIPACQIPSAEPPALTTRTDTPILPPPRRA